MAEKEEVQEKVVASQAWTEPILYSVLRITSLKKFLSVNRLIRRSDRDKIKAGSLLDGLVFDKPADVILQLELMMLTQVDGIICSAKLKQCYDLEIYVEPLRSLISVDLHMQEADVYAICGGNEMPHQIKLYLSYDFPAVGGNVLQLELNLFIQVDGNFMLFRQS
ncbi:hypothetical protein LguiA_029181 [Lonicera macranthoides]